VIIFLNGRFVPEDQAVISVFDRGFLYGDGLFETMLVFKGRIFRWDEHFKRLQDGLSFLKLKLPHSPEQLRGFANQLIAKNEMPDALLRLTISRGVGPRGYSPAGANSPSLVLSLHPAPVFEPGHLPSWTLITSNFRLPAGEPLARYKTCSKLPQILARAEADAAGADDALLLNNEGFVVEGSSSNLFWIRDDVVCTAPLPSGVLPGVTRVVILELCRKLGVETQESNVRPARLAEMAAVFLSLTSQGIVRCRSLDGKAISQSVLVDRISRTYWDLLITETARI
jgi:aminodeoxychorismate lyase